ncbi:MAG: DUF2752 domain-containing protein [Flavihumibacter sp.]|nr:DUF2752 domain-containing protein [Flavihumibacter sp.]
MRLAIYNLGILLLAAYGDFVHWLELHLLKCPFKSTFLIDCPGCGLQRSFVALLKGNISQSFYLYPATIPMLGLLLFTLLHLKFNFKNGSTVIKILYIFIASIIIINYIVKIKTKTLL